MYKVFFISALIFLISCQSNNNEKENYTSEDIVERDSLVYLKDGNVLFSGLIVEKDSTGRVVKEFNYNKGKKHGAETHYEYFEADVAVVVLEGNWKKGKKSGIWNSHDGEGQMTIIKDFNNK